MPRVAAAAVAAPGFLGDVRVRATTIPATVRELRGADQPSLAAADSSTVGLQIEAAQLRRRISFVLEQRSMLGASLTTSSRSVQDVRTNRCGPGLGAGPLLNSSGCPPPLRNRILRRLEFLVDPSARNTPHTQADSRPQREIGRREEEIALVQ